MEDSGVIEEFTLVKDFAVIMVTAGAVTLLFRRLKQPPVVGYLLAGLLIGPYALPTPPVENLDVIRLLADLGLVLLLFGLGLEFSWSKMRQMGFTVLVIGVTEIMTMIGLGYGVGRLLGWSPVESLFLGAALHISSSAIIVKILRDTGRMAHMSSRLIVGILIVEDFAAVVLITILSGVGTTGAADFGDVGSLLLRLLVFIVASLVFGTLLVPRIMGFTHQFRSREAMLITSLGLCFAMALIGKQLGLSVASGAFLIGAIIGDTKHSEEASEVVAPVRDMFAALFFVTVGMLINVREIGEFIVPTIVVSAVFIAGKIVANSLMPVVTGQNLRTSLGVGMGMPVMGEFSLGIAKVGMDSGVVAAPLYPVAGLVTTITGMVGPYIAQQAKATADLFEQRSPRLIKAYISRIEEWHAALRGLTGSQEEQAIRIRHSLKMIILNLLIILVIVVAGTFVLQWVRVHGLFEETRTDLVGLGVGIIVLMMCLPSFVVIWRNVRDVVDDAASFALRRRRSVKRWRHRAMRIIIRDTLLITLTFFVMTWFIPMISNLLSIGSYAVLVPLLLLVTLLSLVGGFAWQIHGKLGQMFSRTILGEEYTSPNSPNMLSGAQQDTLRKAIEKLGAAAGARADNSNDDNRVSGDANDAAQEDERAE